MSSNSIFPLMPIKHLDWHPPQPRKIDIALFLHEKLSLFSFPRQVSVWDQSVTLGGSLTSNLTHSSSYLHFNLLGVIRCVVVALKFLIIIWSASCKRELSVGKCVATQSMLRRQKMFLLEQRRRWRRKVEHFLTWLPGQRSSTNAKAHTVKENIISQAQR